MSDVEVVRRYVGDAMAKLEEAVGIMARAADKDVPHREKVVGLQDDISLAARAASWLYHALEESPDTPPYARSEAADQGSVAGISNRVQRAGWALATDPGELPGRLVGAGETLCVLDPGEFPPDLRIQFARIYEKITRAGPDEGGQVGAVERSIMEMDVEEARDIAGDIWGLVAEVGRRDAAEFGE